MDKTIQPFSQPNYTQFPNDAIDYIMPNVSPATWKIICTAIRETIGFHKTEKQISLTTFQNKTGLTRPTVIKAIAQALDLGIFKRRKKGKGYTFSLNKKVTFSVSDSKEILLIDDTTSKNSLPVDGKNSLPVQGGIKENKDNGNLKKPLKKTTAPPELKKFNLPVKVAEDLEKQFCEVTGVLPPNWENRPRGIYVLWRDPFKEMLKQAIMARLLDAGQEPDPTSTAILKTDINLVKELNHKIIKRMQKDRLTIATPKSLLKTFTSELAYHRNGSGAGETNRKKREEAILDSMAKYQ